MLKILLSPPIDPSTLGTVAVAPNIAFGLAIAGPISLGS